MMSLDVHSEPRLAFGGFVAVRAPVRATIIMDVSDVGTKTANAREGFLTEATHNEPNDKPPCNRRHNRALND